MRPEELFAGVVLVAAPHMDDEVLACGGSLAGLPQTDRVHVIYATDGTRSPVRAGTPPVAELKAIRTEEARAAMSVLAIPERNLHFLDLPDGGLRRQIDTLACMLAGLIRAIQPDQTLIPFRYDRHPDHLALHRAVVRAARQAQPTADLYEYFVYSRYRLLPGGDIRQWIRPQLRLSVDVQAWSARKREALLRYRSQTTLFYNWQRRPILPPKRVEEVSHQPEMFLRCVPDLRDASVFGRRHTWIRLVHWMEPWLKNRKERLAALRRTGTRDHGGHR